jgi:hypothetical protein
MTAAEIDNAFVGAWDADLIFTAGPRKDEHEQVCLTFLPEGVILGTDAADGQLPPAVGEWTAEGDRFSYWLNAVLNDPAGRPIIVVYGHGQGILATDGQAFTASGGSEVYGGNGELLATNLADAHATRSRQSEPERAAGRG